MNKQPNKQPNKPISRWLAISSVCARYGISDTEVRRQVRAGNFPPPVRLGPRLARWSDVQLDEHDAGLIAQLDQREAA